MGGGWDYDESYVDEEIERDVAHMTDELVSVFDSDYARIVEELGDTATPNQVDAWRRRGTGRDSYSSGAQRPREHPDVEARRGVFSPHRSRKSLMYALCYVQVAATHAVSVKIETTDSSTPDVVSEIRASCPNCGASGVTVISGPQCTKGGLNRQYPLRSAIGRNHSDTRHNIWTRVDRDIFDGLVPSARGDLAKLTHSGWLDDDARRLLDQVNVLYPPTEKPVSPGMTAEAAKRIVRLLERRPLYPHELVPLAEKNGFTISSDAVASGLDHLHEQKLLAYTFSGKLTLVRRSDHPEAAGCCIPVLVSAAIALTHGLQLLAKMHS